MVAKIYPSMLSANPTKFGEELSLVEKSGADAIHWDIMDGSFVNEITFGASVVAAHRKMSSLRFDVHLMLKNPDNHIDRFSEAGADIIIIHQETCRHLHKTLSYIKSLEKKAGVALNPATGTDQLKYCFDVLDMVLVMSVNPGNSGQTFIESQLTKISNLKKILPEHVEICVDGGITNKTIKNCLEHGAASFVSGSYIFKNGNYSRAIQNLKQQI
jgi:ribulose-phosphate 3-epimerase